MSPRRPRRTAACSKKPQEGTIHSVSAENEVEELQQTCQLVSLGSPVICMR